VVLDPRLAGFEKPRLWPAGAWRPQGGLAMERDDPEIANMIIIFHLYEKYRREVGYGSDLPVLIVPAT